MAERGHRSMVGLSTRKSQKLVKLLASPDRRAAERRRASGRRPGASQVDVVRSIRRTLGNELFITVDALSDMLRQYRESNMKKWTMKQLTSASKKVSGLLIVAEASIKHLTVLIEFVSKSEKQRKIPSRQLDRLEEAIDDIESGILFLQRISPDQLRVRIADEEGDMAYLETYFVSEFTKGAGFLREGWSRLFYVTAEEPIVMKMSDAESYIWQRSMDDRGVPPVRIIAEFQAIADERGLPVEVFDDHGEHVSTFFPMQHLGERPIATKTPGGRTRQRWGYRRVKAATPRALQESLTPDERKRVKEFLDTHPGQSFSIQEIAEYAGVGVRPVEEWEPHREEEEEFTPNPSHVAKTVREDFGHARKVWLLDLRQPEEG